MDHVTTSPIATIGTMTADEARVLTESIKAAATRLWSLLLEAHERQAWRALGYPSFRDYATKEFQFGQSHVYRLLDHGRVMRDLEEAAGSPVGEIVTEREARAVKPHIALVKADVKERVARGDEPVAAVKNAIQAARAVPAVVGLPVPGPPSNGMQFARIAVMKLEEIRDDDAERDQAFAKMRAWLDDADQGSSDASAATDEQWPIRNAYIVSRKTKDRPNRYMECMVREATYLLDGAVDIIDMSALDQRCVGYWVSDLRRVAGELKRFADRLESTARLNEKGAA